MNISGIAKLAIAVLLCQTAGIIGSIWTSPSIPWYDSLRKPSFAPPNWIIAPIWITLFTLMGVSLYLVWSKGLEVEGVKPALIIFGVQLAINTGWNYFFFGLRNPFLGFVVIVVMLAAILLTILTFFRVSKIAASLLLPYILWVSIAATVNYYLWTLND